MYLLPYSFAEIIIIGFHLYLFGFFIGFEHAENQCQTPSGEKGSCIPLRECTPMYSILTTAKSKGSEVSESDKSYLRQIHCGFNGNHPLVISFLN